MLFGRRNKRGNKRIKPPASETIEVQVMGSDSLDVLKAHDISVMGIGVRVAHLFEGCDLNALVRLVITLPHCQPFLATGIIKHITTDDGPNDRFGVEFTEIADKDARLIREYIDRIQNAAHHDRQNKHRQRKVKRSSYS